jgi:hypothetical protein
MVIFTIKMKDGVPVKDKFWIIALGSRYPSNWTKADCYTLAVALPVVYILTTLVALHHCPLK